MIRLTAKREIISTTPAKFNRAPHDSGNYGEKNLPRGIIAIR